MSYTPTPEQIASAEKAVQDRILFCRNLEKKWAAKAELKRKEKLEKRRK